jgi:hypothetical protein
VTGDRICALKDGPVPSSILNMLNGLIDNPTGTLHPLLAESVSVNRTFTNPHFEATAFSLEEYLSTSDFEALNSVVEAHGRLTFSQLRALPHDMPAYNKAWNDRSNDAPKMAFEDFFEEDDEAIDGAFEEMIENAALKDSFVSSAF